MSDVEVNIPQAGEPPKPDKIIGARHYQYFLFVMTLVVFFGIYTSLSVAIVPMTGETSSATTPGLEWSNPDTILSAFFWAYFIPHITGAKLCQFVGPKWLLLTSMLIGSVFNIVIPPMAENFGSSGVVGCRVMQGLCQGFLYPALDALIKVWAPACERVRVTNVVHAGATLGTAVCMPLAGLMAGSEKGWPVVFYVFGVIGLIWAIVFGTFSHHSPSTHKSMPEDEKRYIKGSTDTDTEDVQDEETPKKVATPWIPIAKSLPVWAILVAGSAHYYGGLILLTQIPTYMTNIMDFDITEDGDLASLPYFAQLGLNLIAVPLTHKLLTKQTLSTTTIRKIFNSLGSFVPAVALLALAFVDRSDQNGAIVLLVLAVGTSVFAQSGYLVNVIDLAPKHAAMLFSLVNVTNTVFSILGPLTVGFLGSDKKDPNLWRNVFLISASVYVGCGIFYCIFASAEKQSWNLVDEEELATGTKIKMYFKKLYLRVKDRVKCSCCTREIACPSFCETCWFKLSLFCDDN